MTYSASIYTLSGPAVLVEAGALKGYILSDILLTPFLALSSGGGGIKGVHT